MQKVALITGASSGFGLATALELAQAGFQVIATMRNPKNQPQIEEAAKREGVEANITVIILDVTDQDRIQQVVGEIYERYGQIDILVNNAGFALGGFVEEIPLDEWRAQFETNLFGLIQMTQAVLPYMRSKRSGTIINMSSISGRIGFPMMAPYVSSKHAVEGYSEALRLEVAPLGIRVVIVEPGAYQTSIWEKGLQAANTSTDADYAPMKGFIMKNVEEITKSSGDPLEVARLIVRIARHPRPKLRYPIGKGVKETIWLKQVLSWSWLERIILRKLR